MTHKLTKEEVRSIRHGIAEQIKEGMSLGDRVLLILVLLMAMFFPGYVFAGLFVQAAKYKFSPSVHELFRLLAQSEYEL